MDLRMPPLLTLRRRDIVPHRNDVNVGVGQRHIILAKMSRMRRVRTGLRCAAICRELMPPLHGGRKNGLAKLTMCQNWQQKKLNRWFFV
jgi:hypothetical protein